MSLYKKSNNLPIVRVVAAVSMILLSSAAMVRADSVCLLDGNHAALEARLSLIASARCSVDVAYFAIDEDCVGRCVTRALIEAAQRGVKVRLLIDGCNNLLGKSLQAEMVDSGVEVREFHPARWSKLQWSHYRMHDKLLVVDRATMIVGGRNLAASYFGVSSKRNFSDRDVMIAGATAQHAACYFQCRWDSSDVMPIRVERNLICRCLPLKEPPNLWQFSSQIEEETTLDALCQRCRLMGNSDDRSSQCASGPSGCASAPEWFEVSPSEICFFHSACGQCSPCGDITSRLLALIQQAQLSIVIETPYLVLTDDFENALRAARCRGVTVHIITNSLVSTNKIAAQAGYECQKKKLLQMGVHLWEFQGPETLHAKGWVVDDCAIIGSYNLDSRAALYDTQTAVLIHDPAVAGAVLASMVRRHQSGSVQPTIQGDSFDPYGIEKHPSAARSVLLHISRPAVPLVKRHL